MIGTLRLGALALASAVRSRRAIAGPALEALLGEPGTIGPVVPVADGARERATTWAMRTLVILSRLPGSGWRNTCLYRSVAECLLLRGIGRPAVVRLGVLRGSRDEIEAHAWTECPGTPCFTAVGDERSRFARLQPG